MMKFFRALLLLTLPYHFYLTSNAQIGYSPEVDSLIQEIRYDSLMLLNRQLTGDTSVVVNGTLDTIVSRCYLEPGNALAAQFIKERFLSFGLDVHVMDYDEDGQNVIATRTGYLYPDKEYIICAHYDSRPFEAYSPGADDNGSGVCGMLEAARLAGGMDFPYTLKFIAFDEEEIGLVGSEAYVDTAFANGDDIMGVLNLDMIAWDSEGDNQVSVSSNPSSMEFLRDQMACMRLYRPELSPFYIYLGASDHWRFWAKSYKAIHVKEDKKDFNPYYHTVDDHFSNISREYFHRVTQACVAAFLSWGLDFRMELQHDALNTIPSSARQEACLCLDPGHPVALGDQRPRLYYRVNEGGFMFVQSSDTIQDSLRFTIPALPYGSKVEYYFAAQDTAGRYVRTLPEGGKGVNPPGTVPPERLFCFNIIKDTSCQYSATGLPLGIPPQDSITRDLIIPVAGRVLDVNARISIQHTSTWDLDIFLISPSGQQIELSTKNGFNEDHYTSTVFDDDASSWIMENKPPFTGSFIPEMPLAQFNDENLQGTWRLKVVNREDVTGQLDEFLLQFRYACGDIYVDADRPVSGDGLSWPTALKTISEACLQDPPPGTTVFIKPGGYQETPMIISNGERTIPLTTGVEVMDDNEIHFPPGTDLSAIDLQSFPGEYYAYVFRSQLRNAGYYMIREVKDSLDYLVVEDASFFHEAGVAGDSNLLSCAVGRPVVYTKHSPDPENEHVFITPDSASGIPAALYIGDSIGDGSQDALPANFNVVDGLEMTGANQAQGIRIQGSSFNIIRNSAIYEDGGVGIHISGNAEHKANHNVITDNVIYNTPEGGICIGNHEQPEEFNRSYYNHLINNEITVTGNGPDSSLHPAIILCNHNLGTVVRDNHIHDLTLEATDGAALEIHPRGNHTLVFGNHFRNIGSTGAGFTSIIRLFEQNEHVEVYNNVLSDSLNGIGNTYAFRLDGSGTDSCRVVHNTIYQIHNGFVLEDNNTISDFLIMNNIVHINENYFTHLGNEGRFDVSNNLYTADPTPDSTMAYYNEAGRQIGIVEFRDAASGNFQLKIESAPAICTGAKLVPGVFLDPDRKKRYADAPDIGAYELKNKVVWRGVVDQQWGNANNWDPATVPGCNSNVIIDQVNTIPRLNTGVNQVNGIYMMQGAEFKLEAPATLIITGY